MIRIRRFYPNSCSHFHETGKRLGPHFSHDLTSMRLHRDLADPELAADLLIQQTGDHQSHDLLFAVTEGPVTVSQLAHLRLLAKRGLATLERSFDSSQQHVVTKRFRQELDGSSLHCLNRRRNIAITGDEDDRHILPIDCDELLQIKTIEPGKRNVENQAAWDENARSRQKLLADSNVSGCQPAKRISNSSASRTEISSSTTNTTGVASDVADAFVA